MTDDRPDVSVVLPIYGNAGTLEELHGRIASALSGERFEVLYVIDGSPDNSLYLAEGIAARDPRVRVVDLVVNRGQNAAVRQGLEAARGDLLVSLDADLQDIPEAIPSLLAEIRRGYEVVFGGRAGRYAGLFRTATSRLYKLTLRALTGIPTNAGLYLVMTAGVRDRLLALPQMPSIVAAIAVLGPRFSVVPVGRSDRTTGRSAYTFWKRLRLGLSAVLWVLSQKAARRRAARSSRLARFPLQ